MIQCGEPQQIMTAHNSFIFIVVFCQLRLILQFKVPNQASTGSVDTVNFQQEQFLGGVKP